MSEKGVCHACERERACLHACARMCDSSIQHLASSARPSVTVGSSCGPTCRAASWPPRLRRCCTRSIGTGWGKKESRSTCNTSTWVSLYVSLQLTCLSPSPSASSSHSLAPDSPFHLQHVAVAQALCEVHLKGQAPVPHAPVILRELRDPQPALRGDCGGHPGVPQGEGQNSGVVQLAARGLQLRCVRTDQKYIQTRQSGAHRTHHNNRHKQSSPLTPAKSRQAKLKATVTDRLSPAAPAAGVPSWQTGRCRPACGPAGCLGGSSGRSRAARVGTPQPPAAAPPGGRWCWWAWLQQSRWPGAAGALCLQHTRPGRRLTQVIWPVRAALLVVRLMPSAVAACKWRSMLQAYSLHVVLVWLTSQLFINDKKSN